MKHKNNELVENVYQEIVGKWLVCSVCGQESILYNNETLYDIDWGYATCPDCLYDKCDSNRKEVVEGF